MSADHGEKRRLLSGTFLKCRGQYSPERNRGVADHSGHLPVWIRRRDGSQVPFDADRICQSLYAAAESLGAASAFVTRELTDVVLHFIAREELDAVPTTGQIAEHVEKIVREVGQPALARRYAELQRQTDAVELNPKRITLVWPNSPEQLVHDCRRAYALRGVFARDVAAAAEEGLLHLDDLDSPATLASVIVETARLTELPWWPSLDDWRGMAGRRWIVDSPEAICTPRMHPALTPHLCERLLALPTLAQRDVELHLNAAATVHDVSPLFAAVEEEPSRQAQSGFLDGLLERWKALPAAQLPAIAWHLGEDSFHEEAQRRQLHDLLRQALQGRPIRFVFDRPRSPVALAEGLDRKCPGVLLEVGLDLAALAARPEVKRDGATLLKKLPSLAYLAVSAARQKRDYLRNLPETSPLKRQFLIERAAALVTPLGLDEAVRGLTGEGLAHSPLALDFALRILHTLKTTLQEAGRSILLDLRLDGPALSAADWNLAPQRQFEIAGILHARAGAGTMTQLLAEDQADAERLAELLQWAWTATSVVRVQLQRAGSTLQQGELPIMATDGTRIEHG
jgi:ATP cone domain